jgi:hypothetical protein
MIDKHGEMIGMSEEDMLLQDVKLLCNKILNNRIMEMMMLVDIH